MVHNNGSVADVRREIVGAAIHGAADDAGALGAMVATVNRCFFDDSIQQPVNGLWK